MTRNPTDLEAEALSARADALQQLRRYAEALAAYDAALALKSDFAAAWNNRGIALHELGHHEAALASYERALSLQPDFALAWNNRGNTLLDLKDYAAALASQSRALQLEPNLVEALNNRGNLLRHFNRHAEALESYDRAVALRPDFAEAHTNRAHALREMNRIDEAREAYQTVVGLVPDRVGPYRKLASVTRLTYDHPCYLALERFAGRRDQLSPQDRIELHFALADALTQLGADEPAFAHVLQGNALQRRLTGYDEAATMARYAWVRQTFTRDHLQACAGGGDLSDSPVFIIGMPRSGSTLIEQVLASHPEVYGAGEYEAFSDALGECVRGKAGEGLAETAILGALSAPDFTAIGAAYERRIGYLGGIGRAHRRVVDKTLPNFMQLGLIHLALPNARFIHARRNPVETCLSCFSKLLGTASFSFELGELGRYYAAYDALMAHWRAVLPAGVLLEVDYEAMVGDLPAQVRRLLAHCGLAWDPACLAFERNPRPVATASALQVRQPLYSGAVRRRRPAPELIAALMAALAPLGSAAAES
jgi:tetratricopeptide (TPR) repeat protein